MEKFNKKLSNEGDYNYSHLSICGRASELASQYVSHFIRFSDDEQPYCVFCLQGVESINKNKIKQKIHFHDTISLEGARIG
ncbi:MAG: hypothetical protein ACW967_01735 [Candidatus Hodarchaeales archaeon]|jgi:hypothetical protein